MTQPDSIVDPARGAGLGRRVQARTQARSHPRPRDPRRRDRRPRRDGLRRDDDRHGRRARQGRQGHDLPAVDVEGRPGARRRGVHEGGRARRGAPPRHRDPPRRPRRHDPPALDRGGRAQAAHHGRALRHDLQLARARGCRARGDHRTPGGRESALPASGHRTRRDPGRLRRRDAGRGDPGHGGVPPADPEAADRRRVPALAHRRGAASRGRRRSASSRDGGPPRVARQAPGRRRSRPPTDGRRRRRAAPARRAPALRHPERFERGGTRLGSEKGCGAAVGCVRRPAPAAQNSAADRAPRVAARPWRVGPGAGGTGGGSHPVNVAWGTPSCARARARRGRRARWSRGRPGACVAPRSESRTAPSGPRCP